MKSIRYIVFIFIFISSSTSPVFAEDFQRVDSLELLLSYANTEAEKTDLLIELSIELQNNAPNLALGYAQEALLLSVKQAQGGKEITAMIILAEIYWGMTDYKMAMEFATKAKIKAKKNELSFELAQAYRVIGLIYVDLGSYKKASEYFFKSLKLFEEIKNKEGTARAMSSIGYVFFDQENFDKALEYYFKSLNLAKESNDLLGIARGLNNVAAVYGSQGEYLKVKQYIEEAIIINKRLDNKLWVGINYMNLGLTYQKLHNQETALEYFEMAIAIFRALDNTIWQLKCYLNIGGYYRDSKNYKQSLEYAHLALNQAQKHEMKKMVHDSYRALHQSYLAMEDTINAYHYLLLKMEAKDSLDFDKNKALLSKLELQYDFEKKEQEEFIKQQRNDFITILVILSLSFALVLIFLLWNRQRIKARNIDLEKTVLEEKLEFKNKEFTMHMMSLMKKNEIIERLGKKLILVEKEAVKDETKQAISRIAAELQKSTDTEIWEEFELRFSQVHSDFYTDLLHQFPKLTPSEQKLCAFLRLNMTTKEISELTGQSTSTLETARYRLRKKLNISNPKVNLITFLSQI